MAHTGSVPPLEAAGPTGADPIVFVHGIRVNRKVWLPQMEALHHDYRVIALDLPGHGALAATPFGLEAAVRTVAGVIDEEAGGRAVIVGCSLGGYVSMTLGSRYPEKVRGLVLSGCSLAMDGAIGVALQIGARLLAVSNGRWLNPVHELLCRRMLPARIAEPIIAAGFRCEAVPQAVRELVGNDFCAMLRVFPGPVLLLNGERDTVFRRHEALFAGAAQDAACQIIPRATHRCNLEYPDLFTEAVRAFAQSIGR